MIAGLFSLCIVVLAMAPILIRFAEAESLAICFWRLLISALLLIPALAWRQNWKAFTRLSRFDLAQLGSCGLFLFLHFYFFFLSTQTTSIANCMVLFSLNSVSTALGAWLFFRERMKPHLMAACVIGLAGVAATMIGTMNAAGDSSLHNSWQGDVCSLISAIMCSCYVLSGKSLRRKMPNIPFAFSIYLQTAVYAGLIMLTLHRPFTGYSNQTWLAFFALAVFTTLMGHAIFTYCLNFLDVNFMSCMTLTEPVLATIVAGYLFHEVATGMSMLGFLLTSASVCTLYWPHFSGTFRNSFAQAKYSRAKPRGHDE